MPRYLVLRDCLFKGRLYKAGEVHELEKANEHFKEMAETQGADALGVGAQALSAADHLAALNELAGQRLTPEAREHMQAMKPSDLLGLINERRGGKLSVKDALIEYYALLSVGDA
jgi:hypothetical protein